MEEDSRYGYMNDGFDIADSLGNLTLIPQLQESSSDENFGKIPAFAVSYAKQNQSYFENIQVNMDNPQVTEQTINLTQKLSENFGSPNRRTAFSGQDLYRVYSNHSYTCSVEMMGCAQITPLMYFQLQGQPMFKGAYIIQKVQHNLTPGNMITKFTGVRMDKNNIPFNQDIFPFARLISEMSDNPIFINTQEDVNNFTVGGELKTGSNPPDWSGFVINHQQAILDNTYSCDGINYCFKEISELLDKNGQPLIIFSDGANENSFNGLQEHMRKLIVLLAKTIDENYDYKLCLTSLKRNNTGRSQHNSGLAIDMHGCTRDFRAGGLYQKKKMFTPQLFDLILNGFTNWIDQLLWEDKTTTDSFFNNVVDNVLHLSSNGENNPENRRNIGQMSYNGNTTETIDITDRNSFTPLSKQFLASVSEAVKNNRIKLSDVFNFKKSQYISDGDLDNLLSNYEISRPNLQTEKRFEFSEYV
jgi:hypothetical protein